MTDHDDSKQNNNAFCTFNNLPLHILSTNLEQSSNLVFTGFDSEACLIVENDGTVVINWSRTEYIAKEVPVREITGAIARALIAVRDGTFVEETSNKS